MNWEPNCKYCGQYIKFKKNWKRHVKDKHPGKLKIEYPDLAQEDPGPAPGSQEDQSEYELPDLDLEDLTGGEPKQAPFIPQDQYTPGAGPVYTGAFPPETPQQKEQLIKASKVIKIDRIFNTVSVKLNSHFKTDEFPTVDTKPGKDQLDDLQEVTLATLDYYKVNMSPPVALTILIIIVYLGPILVKLNVLDKILDKITGKPEGKNNDKKEQDKNRIEDRADNK